ncbi:MAG: hypothetical protein ACRECG_16600, partial [Bradyrhizobium sp.]
TEAESVAIRKSISLRNIQPSSYLTIKTLMNAGSRSPCRRTGALNDRDFNSQLTMPRKRRHRGRKRRTLGATLELSEELSNGAQLRPGGAARLRKNFLLEPTIKQREIVRPPLPRFVAFHRARLPRPADRKTGRPFPVHGLARAGVGPANRDLIR